MLWSPGKCRTSWRRPSRIPSCSHTPAWDTLRVGTIRCDSVATWQPSRPGFGGQPLNGLPPSTGYETAAPHPGAPGSGRRLDDCLRCHRVPSAGKRFVVEPWDEVQVDVRDLACLGGDVPDQVVIPSGRIAGPTPAWPRAGCGSEVAAHSSSVNRNGLSRCDRANDPLRLAAPSHRKSPQRKKVRTSTIRISRRRRTRDRNTLNPVPPAPCTPQVSHDPTSPHHGDQSTAP